MEWKEVLEDPSLRDLPYKIETNEWGNIMMTPASHWHAVYQTRIAILLDNFGIGRGISSVECPVQTSKGVKVADVAWMSVAFLKKHGLDNPALPESPEIVVEVLSPSNRAGEMEGKRKLYFEAGAKEFWLCNEFGNMRLFDPLGELEKSGMFPEFPEQIKIGMP